MKHFTSLRDAFFYLPRKSISGWRKDLREDYERVYCTLPGQLNNTVHDYGKTIVLLKWVGTQ